MPHLVGRGRYFATLPAAQAQQGSSAVGLAYQPSAYAAPLDNNRNGKWAANDLCARSSLPEP
jgi:hypothetical protein